jgi:predicted nucleic acid-binding protein
MRRVLFDTNVVLDVLLDREPHAEASAAAWAAVETGAAEGLLAAHAVTTVHRLAGKELGPAKAKRVVAAILQVFGIAAVDGAVLQEALQSPLSDFEDAVTAAAARLAGCDCIVTRDPKGFRASPVRAFTPEAVLPLLGT